MKKLFVLLVFFISFIKSATANDLNTAISYLSRYDYYKAKELFEQLSAQGNPVANTYLGNIYENALGVKKDYQKAWYFYQKAAEQDFAAAYFNLGNLQEKGLGVKPDLLKAISFYRKATEKSFPRAEIALGRIYAASQNEDDKKEAIKWFNQAAASGHQEAFFELGKAYRFGNGVRQDYLKAIELFKKSADTGNIEAQVNLANLYFEGYENPENRNEKPINKDYKKALFWYNKAAEAGSFNARYMLGYMYMNGIGVSANQDVAKKWLLQNQ